MFIIYAIYNYEAQKLYIGQTGNLKLRILQHNQKRGNHFTARFEGEWKLIYTKSLPTRSEALIREKQLKSAEGRAYISQFISQFSIADKL